MANPKDELRARLQAFRQLVHEKKEEFQMSPAPGGEALPGAVESLAAFETQALREAEGVRGFANTGGLFSTLSKLFGGKLPSALQEEVNALASAVGSASHVADEWDYVRKSSADLRGAMERAKRLDRSEVEGYYDLALGLVDLMIREVEKTPIRSLGA
jgi:hypothetical protein